MDEDVREWRPIETAPKDGRFYLFDSSRWPHVRVLRWAKVRNAAAMAFVSEYGIPPSYLPQVWMLLPDRWNDAGRVPKAEAGPAYTGTV